MEKRNAMCGTLLGDGKKITTPCEISLTLKNFNENIFQKNSTKSISDREMFISDIHLPTISNENYTKCEDVFINLLKQPKIEGSLSNITKEAIIKL